MKNSILLAFCLIISITLSQVNTDTLITSFQDDNYTFYNPLSKPNTYAKPDNPNYWKNKLPHEGYWQQDVHYIINAEIIDTDNVIKANQRLIYTNNSPDDLNHVFFHLYQNAFEPDSYLDKFRQSNKMITKYREDEKKKKGTEILSIRSNNENLDVEIDNTIMKVMLTEPIKSGATIIFDID